MLSCKQIPIRPIPNICSVEENSSSTETLSLDNKIETETLEVETNELEDKTILIEAEQLRLEVEKQEFDDLKADWLEEVTNLREEAQQTGYQTGYTEGLESGKKEGYEAGLQQAFLEMNDYIQTVKSEGIQLKKEFEEQLIQAQPFLLEIIEKSVESIIAEKLEQGENRHLKMIEKALVQVSKHQCVTLNVSKEQYDWVKEQKEELEKLCPQATFQILINPMLKDYDVLVETEQTELDFRLDLQLENWKEDLKRMVG